MLPRRLLGSFAIVILWFTCASAGETEALEVLAAAPLTRAHFPELAAAQASEEDFDLPAADALQGALLYFSRAMVPATRTGREESHPPAGCRLDPPAAGSWIWRDEFTLVFRAQEPLRLATDYRLHVQNIASLAGLTPASSYQLDLSTSRPEVVYLRPSAEREIVPEAVLLVAFNQTVRPENLVSAARFEVQLRPGELTPIPIAAAIANENPRTLQVTPSRPFPPGSQVTLVVAAGLRGVEGPLGMAQEARFSYWTAPPFAPTRLHRASTDYDDLGRPVPRTSEISGEPTELWNPRGEYFLQFTSAIDRNSALEHIVLVDLTDSGAPVARLEASEAENLRQFSRARQRMDRVYLSSLFAQARPGHRVAVRVLPGIRDARGRSHDMPWETQLALGHVEARLAWGFPSTQVVVEARQGASLPLVSVNVKRARIGIKRLASASALWSELGTSLVEPDLSNIELGIQRDETTTTRFALDSWLDGRQHGLLAVSAAAEHILPGAIYTDGVVTRSTLPRPPIVLAQVTDLGLTARVAAGDLLIWVTRLSDATPAIGTRVKAWDESNELVIDAITAADGIVRSKRQLLPESKLAVLATLGTDKAILRLQTPSTRAPEGWTGILFTDRGVYRPGETLHARALIREKRGGCLVKPALGKVTIAAWSHLEGESVELEGELTAQGAVDFSLKLADKLAPGPMTLEVSRLDTGTGEPSSVSTRVLVANYRPVPLEVTMEVEPEEHRAGDAGTVRVKARHFTGAPAAGARLEWEIKTKEHLFQPPGFLGFVFSSAIRRGLAAVDAELNPETREQGEILKRLSCEGVAVLGDDGTHELALPSLAGAEMPLQIEIEARIVAPDRREVAARKTISVLPGGHHVGLEQPPGRVLLGAEVAGRVVVITPGGAVAYGLDAEVTLWARGDDTPRSLTLVQSWIVKTQGNARYAVRPPRAGNYLLEATVRDAQGRPVSAHATFDVVARESIMPTSADDSLTLELIPERASYLPGETARVYVQNAWTGRALLTVEHEHVLEHRLVTLTGENDALDVPIRLEHAPNIFVTLTAVRGRTATLPQVFDDFDPHGPKYRWGVCELNVSPHLQALDVKVSVDRPVCGPGEEVLASACVRTADGSPARANITLWAVDEAVLALTAHATPDPMGGFYWRRKRGVTSVDSRQLLPGLTSPDEDAPEIVSFYGHRLDSAPPLPRRDFCPTPLWLGSIDTNDEGIATASFRLPESLTTFRVLAVAAAGEAQFGSGETHLQVSQPLCLLAAAPRFLRQGDTASFGVVVVNQSGHPVQVEVTAAPLGLTLNGARAIWLDLQASASREATFSWMAHEPGEAVLTFRARSFPVGADPATVAHTAEDALECRLPIQRARELESVALAGTIRGNERRTLPVPAGASINDAEVDFTASASGLGDWTGGLHYLVEYPHGCLEQRASRLRALVLLAQLGDHGSWPSIQGLSLRAAAQKALDELPDFHHRHGGGLTLWPRGDESLPHLTAYVLDVLGEARLAGLQVASSFSDDLTHYLTSHLHAYAEAPIENTGAHESTVATWVAHALAPTGAATTAVLTTLSSRATLLPLSTRLLLARALCLAPTGDRELARRLVDQVLVRVIVSADGLVPREAESSLSEAYLDGPAVIAASLLSTLLVLDPQHQLVLPVRQALLALRQGGRWESTWANAQAIAALLAEEATRSAASSNFMASLRTLGDGGRELWRGTFTSAQAPPVKLTWPTSTLFPSSALSPLELELGLTGRGTLGYHLRVMYDPGDAAAQSVEHGMALTRRYLAAGSDLEVSELQVGDIIRVELVLQPWGRESRGDGRDRWHLGVVDPLPAGLEVVDPNFATSRTDDAASEEAPPAAFDHVEFHSDHIKLFASRSSSPLERHVYRARATTPGRFHVPGARAELLYRPEIAARTGQQVLTITYRKP